MGNFQALLDDIGEIMAEVGMKLCKLIGDAGEDKLMVATRSVIA